MTALEQLRNKAQAFQQSERGKAYAAAQEAKRKATTLTVVSNPRIGASDHAAALRQYGWS